MRVVQTVDPGLDLSGRRVTDRYLPALACCLAGYVVFGRSFAYLGIAPLYIGETMFLLGFACFLASGAATAVFATPPALAALALMCWVLLRVAQGVGAYGIDALRDGVVALYGGFAFFVAALLVERPARLAQVLTGLRTAVRIVLPVAILAYFAGRFVQQGLNVPGIDIPLLSARSGELATHMCGAVALVLLGLCSVGRLQSALLLFGGLLVASQSRGGMLALALPLVFLLLVTGRLRQLVLLATAICVVMTIAYLGDLSIEIPIGERPISARALVDNVFSILASNDANNLDGTKQWRLNWWRAIQDYTFSGAYFWTGKGFGPNLAEVDGFVVGLEWGGPVLRSPHSVHMTYLARAGVPGLFLWLLTVGTWMAALLLASVRAHRRGEHQWSRFFIFLVCYVGSIVIDASFDVALEGPMLGIPFWVLFGIGMGSLMIYDGLHAQRRYGFGPRLRSGAAGLVGLLLVLMAIGSAGTARAAEGVARTMTGEKCPSQAVALPVGADLQAIVGRSPPTTTFCVKTGVHRAQQISPKSGQTFIGEPGAILNGAVRIDAIVERDGHWVAVVPKLALAEPPGVCLKSRPACKLAVRAFLDDAPLEPVLQIGDLRRGTSYLDARTGELHLADDPRGRKLEITRKSYAFWSNAAKHVTVRGLVVEKYATPSQQGAIFGDEDALASGWVIDGNEVRLNSGAGISTGDGARVLRNKIYRNGQLGISPNGTGVLIEDNDIYENNIYGFDATWEGGGVKAGRIERLTMRGNRVHDNLGSGLWCDVECRSVLFEGNLVERNADAGIFYEISFDAVIRNNVVRLNGTGAEGQQGSPWFWGAGIQIAASERVEVYGNTVVVAADRGSGIMLIDQAREPVAPRRELYRTAGNVVRDNRIVYLGRAGTSGGASDVGPTNPNRGIIETAANRFDANAYVFTQKDVGRAAFIWGGEPIAYDRFRQLGQERNGRIIQGETER